MSRWTYSVRGIDEQRCPLTRTALVAKSELSASTQYGLELSGRVRIRAEVILVLRV